MCPRPGQDEQQLSRVLFRARTCIRRLFQRPRVCRRSLALPLARVAARHIRSRRRYLHSLALLPQRHLLAAAQHRPRTTSGASSKWPRFRTRPPPWGRCCRVPRTCPCLRRSARGRLGARRGTRVRHVLVVRRLSPTRQCPETLALAQLQQQDLQEKRVRCAGRCRLRR